MSKARRNVPLTERTSLSKSPVDRDRKVIRGVKVLGLVSRNGRRYTLEALKGAVSLYEGAKVKANHPRRPNETRDVDDTLGWFEGVEVRADGLYAREFHYLESHPLSARICEAADRRPDLFGFSHNIQGDTEEQRDGTELVRSITEVRSVDLVDEPATTGGLFEETRKVTKLKAFLEAIKLPKQLNKKGRARIARLMEAGMMDADMDVDMAPPAEDAPAGDHEQALKDGFRAACQAILDDGGLDVKGRVAKLKELLTAEEKLLSKGGGGDGGAVDGLEEEEDEDIEEDCEDDEEKKPMKESVELKLLRREKKARRLCEEADVAADSVLLEAMSRLPDEAAMKRMVDREKGRSARPGQQPRSGSGGGKNVTEGKKNQAAQADDIGEFMAALRN